MVTNITTKATGTFKLKDTAHISDPCYEIISGTTVKNVLPGTYHAFQRECTAGEWGRRVSRLMAIHEDYLEDISYEAENKNALKENCKNVVWNDEDIVGVDSGQMGIYDYNYFKDHENERNYGDPNDWYNRVCDMTLTKENGGVMDEKCTVSCTGYGDGSYEVLAFRDKETKKVVAFVIDFDLEHEEEEEENNEILINCENCCYATKNENQELVCNCGDSPYYQKEVEPDEWCDAGECE